MSLRNLHYNRYGVCSDPLMYSYTILQLMLLMDNGDRGPSGATVPRLVGRLYNIDDDTATPRLRKTEVSVALEQNGNIVVANVIHILIVQVSQNVTRLQTNLAAFLSSLTLYTLQTFG